MFRKRGCGEQVAELFRLDLAIPSRPMSARWQSSIEAIRRAHRTCRHCGRDVSRYVPTSTWKCWTFMDATGDFGDPAAA